MSVTTLPADNPFAQASPLPYQTPPFDRIRDEHWLPAFAAGIAAHRDEVDQIAAAAAAPTFTNTIEALERSGALLTRVSKVFFNLTESNTNPTIQQVQTDVAPRLSAHQDAIWLDARLFARVEAVFATRATLDAEQQRLVERYHLAFVRNGARLPTADQQRLRAINEQLSSLTTDFQERLLADTKALAVLVDSRDELDGLDDSAVAAAAAAAVQAGQPGRFLLSLQLPSSQAALSSLRHRPTRQRVFAASLQRCARGNEHDTRDLVARIAALRAERAGLLGAASHADHVLADQMAGSASAVAAMLADMARKIVPKAQGEAKELQAWLDTEAPRQRLEPWDWTFVATRLRAARHAFDENELRQYFELETVLAHGVFFMAECLYGITLRPRPDLPVYHPDVRVFEVFERDGSALGLFYADYYARPGKRGGAWMDNFVDQSKLLSQRPVVVNVMNVPHPGPGQPTLLGRDDVTTLFHEFGHAVHGLFSQVRYPMLSGTAVPRDFVEFPSQFHEDFAFEPAVLARCARHFRTGAPLPQELALKLRAARMQGQGFASLEYVAAAILDMAWHSLPPSAQVSDVEAFEQAALQRAGVAWELVPPRYRSTYFAHIWPGGYGAGYYAYLWSEALAADAYAVMLERGGMTAANGATFREAVLSKGMTEEPMQMFARYCGRPLDTTALLRRRGLS